MSNYMPHSNVVNYCMVKGSTTPERAALWCAEHGLGRHPYCRCVQKSKPGEPEVFQVAEICELHNWAYSPVSEVKRFPDELSGRSEQWKKLRAAVAELRESTQHALDAFDGSDDHTAMTAAKAALADADWLRGLIYPKG